VLVRRVAMFSITVVLPRPREPGEQDRPDFHLGPEGTGKACIRWAAAVGFIR